MSCTTGTNFYNKKYIRVKRSNPANFAPKMSLSVTQEERVAPNCEC
jgi:hypothetical protein